MLYPSILFLLYDDFIGILKSLISCVGEMFSLIILESKHDVFEQQHLVMKGPSLNPQDSMLDHMTMHNGGQQAEQVNLRTQFLCVLYRYRFSKENTKKTPYRSRKANYKKVIMMGDAAKMAFYRFRPL